MKISLSENHQREMRLVHFDGAPGIMVSGLVWLVAAAVGYSQGVNKAVWTLLIGGVLIAPISAVFTKVLGRTEKTSPNNGLLALAIASTIWLILGCAMSYGLYLLKPQLFFPAMMATIGCRYMVFATLFGMPIYWLLGICLLAAANFTFLAMAAPVIAAAIGGFIEIVFACFIFAKARSST